MKCRHCNNDLTRVFCDLRTCPPSNAMVKSIDLGSSEVYFPLKVFVCDKCWLVQVDEVEKAENIFNEEYTYFSSYSSSWLEHAKRYTDYMTNRFGFDEQSLVVEIASNDGYLLKFFKEKKIPVLGIEPSSNTARVAEEKGIPSIIDFFSSELAMQELYGKANLILGNNVLAHVPDINDFIRGVTIALAPKGICTFEFPHLCRLVEFNQFDTIYHEHFSYLSLTAVKSVFENQGLELFDVQELPTHGGSLRIFAKRKEDGTKEVSPSVLNMLNWERDLGVNTLAYYEGFQEKVENIHYEFVQFLLRCRKDRKKVVGYGAAAKGNTLLNYCGVKGTDLIEFVVDASSFKQGRFLPGSRIPVWHPDKVNEVKPDFIIIFPWNLRDEISENLSFVKEWGGQFVVAIPELEIF